MANDTSPSAAASAGLAGHRQSEMEMQNTFKHREAWLQALIAEMRPVFAKHGATIPENVRVSCGFPSVGGRSGFKRQTIGECWSPIRSEDGSWEIFINPTLAKPMRVAGVTGHEMIHATVGLEAGHRGPFKQLALAIGLTGRMSATTEGEDFIRTFTPILEDLGPYPHAALDARSRLQKPEPGEAPLSSGPKTQSTRLHKVMCRHCGYVARVTMKWLNEGMPVCPIVGHGSMLMAVPDGTREFN
jgi:hypothetical protein